MAAATSSAAAHYGIPAWNAAVFAFSMTFERAALVFGGGVVPALVGRNYFFDQKPDAFHQAALTRPRTRTYALSRALSHVLSHTSQTCSPPGLRSVRTRLAGPCARPVRGRRTGRHRLALLGGSRVAMCAAATSSRLR